MGKLNDLQIKAWVKADERFEQRGDGAGLYLRYRAGDASPVWIYRYRFGGKARIMVMGNYRTMSLAKARKEAELLGARVKLGHDVAGEKKARKAEALAAIEAERRRVTVAAVTDEYFERMVAGKWKRAHQVRLQIDKDIIPNLGKLAIEDVTPSDIDAMLRKVVDRGAPKMANHVLRWARRIFDYAVKCRLCPYSPAAPFDVTDAGGREVARDRALSRGELVALFEAMRKTPNFMPENALAVKLLLLLAVRKNELLQARWDEFALEGGVWHLPAERVKTDADIAIPLAPQALAALRELHTLACGSDYLFPARKAQRRRLPYIAESTLNMALVPVEANMPGVEHFTVHDLRRTARTQLAALGIPPHIAEKCLNHKLTGVEGRYDRYNYFDERRAALQQWADLLEQLEKGSENVIPLHEKRVGVVSAAA